MGKIILIALLLFCGSLKAQVLPGFQVNTTYGIQAKRFVADSLQGLPRDTFTVPTALKNYPWVASKSNAVYVWNYSSYVWQALSGGSSGWSLTGKILDLGITHYRV